MNVYPPTPILIVANGPSKPRFSFFAASMPPSMAPKNISIRYPTLIFAFGHLSERPAKPPTLETIIFRSRLLCADLKERDVVSKRRIFCTGERRGGKPIDRSALYLILNNRTYFGETTHKGSSYPGEYQAIVPSELFNAVQQRLADLRPPIKSISRASQDAPYVGLIFDETREAMLPTYAIKRPGLRYRYYVSKPATKGERSGAAVSRIPAPPFDAFMSAIMARLGFSVSDHNEQLRSTVRKIEIQSGSIVVRFDRNNVLARWRAAKPDDGVA
jgi:hypothetical protein